MSGWHKVKTLYKCSTTSRSGAFQLTTKYINNIICFSKINAYIKYLLIKHLVLVDKAKELGVIWTSLSVSDRFLQDFFYSLRTTNCL